MLQHSAIKSIRTGPVRRLLSCHVMSCQTSDSFPKMIQLTSSKVTTLHDIIHNQRERSDGNGITIINKKDNDFSQAGRRGSTSIRVSLFSLPFCSSTVPTTKK
mmetsp:Transcript_60578/g.67761  ORF Transcript_60578/g.67761 Transcript_60578/m.67761 type:complete len:103 (-) Transcript_60578:42-350(-)